MATTYSIGVGGMRDTVEEGDGQADSRAWRCARHPAAETRIRCATCSEPLCLKCMIFTPVGIKCRGCAQLRRPVQYTITPTLYARIIPGAVAVALGLGWLLSYMPYPGLVCGIVVGVAVSAALKHISGHKRGQEMEIIACATVALAVVSSGLLVAARLPATGDWNAAIHEALTAQMLGPNALSAMIGCYVAVQQFR